MNDFSRVPFFSPPPCHSVNRSKNKAIKKFATRGKVSGKRDENLARYELVCTSYATRMLNEVVGIMKENGDKNNPSENN